MTKVIAVYDGTPVNGKYKRLAYLQNAYNISFDKQATALWTGSFSLPYSDYKTKYCQAFNLVELWDEDAGGDDRYVGLFRIMPRTEETLGADANIVYTLEHVLSTLMDDTMIGFHEIGNTGVYTANSIGYILNNQSTKRWQLGTCDYAHQYLYGWENENLLSALLSIVQPFAETDYYWDFNTQSTPWLLYLRKTNPDPKIDIRYRKNLSGLRRIVDPTNLTTRLYCYGYGDGDNVLGISEVNGGLPYLESVNVAKYGVITQTWTDERFTEATALRDVGRAMLTQLEEPAVTYEIDVQTIYSAGDLEIGDTVRMVSEGLDELMIVNQVSKDDVTGAPSSGKITLGAGTIDISTSVAELADRQRIAENYSQGAESIFTDSFTDNADTENPANIRFTIPENTVHVNEILFSCNLTDFRAYSRAVDGGGQGGKTTLDGHISTDTTLNNAYQYLTALDGGKVVNTNTTPRSAGISDGGAPDYWTVKTTSDGGGQFGRTPSIHNKMPDNQGITHNHGMDQGQQFAIGGYLTGDSESGYDIEFSYTHYGWAESGDHWHDVQVGDHTHDVPFISHYHQLTDNGHHHQINLPDHQHPLPDLTHTHPIEIADHRHNWSLPNHTHNLHFGIQKALPQYRATGMSIYLDNTLIGNYGTSVSNINLIPYISKYSNGNVLRGNHVITVVPTGGGSPAILPIAPEIDPVTKAEITPGRQGYPAIPGLSRVEANFLIRLFTNMHSGGQY